jgi:hypothetical protein
MAPAALLLLVAVTACAQDGVVATADGAIRGRPVPLTLTMLTPEAYGPFRVRGSAGAVEVYGQRNTGTCGRSGEREVYRASRRADTLVLWLHRYLPPVQACAGAGLGFFYRARLAPLLAGTYQLYVIEQDMGAPDTVYRTQITVSAPVLR